MYRILYEPIPVAAWVCGRSPVWIVGSKPAEGMDVICCECCVLSGRGLCVGLITTDYGVSEYDRETSILSRSWPTRGYCAMGKKNLYDFDDN